MCALGHKTSLEQIPQLLDVTWRSGLEMEERIISRAVFLWIFFALLFLSPTGVIATGELVGPVGNTKTGPFVDKLIIKRAFEGEESQIEALINNEIDAIDDAISPDYVAQLENAENIVVDYFLRNGYGYFAFNCLKYPLNQSSLRRAIAMALDKNKICQEAWDGLAEPLDSMVPKCNPWSIEEEMDYHYYSSDLETSHELLDYEGFIDADADGFRETPTGLDFDINIEVAQSSAIAVKAGEIVKEALDSLDINCTLDVTDFYGYLTRLYYGGDFDLCFLGNSFSNNDLTFLTEFEGESCDWEGRNNNFARWQNATYAEWNQQLMTSVDYGEIREAATRMQEIWIEQCPLLICYENMYVSAYRTDRLTGFLGDADWGVMTKWNNLKVHLKESEGGPFGGTLRWATYHHPRWNPLQSCSCYPSQLDYQMYDSLFVQRPDGTDLPWMVKAYEVYTHEDDSSISENHTRYELTLLDNMTWSDGHPLTSDDVAFTFNFYKNNQAVPQSSNLQNLSAIYAPNPNKVVLEFSTQSYWNLHKFSYLYVFPKHIVADMGSDELRMQYPYEREEDWMHNWVTSGAFNLTAYEEGNFTELTYRPDYFFAPNHSLSTPDGDWLNENALVLSIVAASSAVVVVVLVYTVMRKGH
jgi:ABC-type transport system substrate-binding protein